MFRFFFVFLREQISFCRENKSIFEENENLYVSSLLRTPFFVLY